MPSRFASIVFILVLCLATAGLYVPFATNVYVFDDHNFFTTQHVFYYAQQPSLSFIYTRIFPNFLLGLVHVLSGGDVAWNRYLSIALHCLVVIALYCFLQRALVRVWESEPLRRRIALVACLWVALNPMAVYTTGYLVQRTIVLATLFGLVSATLYLRAQQQERNVDLFSAALLAYLSVMSKEHAVLLPAATLVLTPMVTDWTRGALRRAAGYFLLTLPGAVWAIFHRSVQDAMVAGAEVYSGEVLSQFARPDYLDSSFGLWLMGAGTQLLLFWKYLFLWCVPNPGWMSVDMRVDFELLWSGWYGIAGAAVSVAVVLAVAAYWLRTRGRGWVGALSAALLFAVGLFAIEFSTLRVQEPFVLYRSFLWMPAYALLFSLVLGEGCAWATRHGAVAGRALWIAAVAGGLALFPLAQDRLRSFSSEESVWQDALDKLPRPDVPGADRIYYNLAGEAFKRKDYTQALLRSEQVIAQNPRAFHGYLARGTSLLALGQLDAAERSFDEAGTRNPPNEFLGYLEFKHCAVADARGNREETIACLRRSAKMGYEGARFRLKMANIPLED